MMQKQDLTLVFTDDDHFAAGLSALMSDDGAPVVTEKGSLRTANGHAHELANGHGVVIFEADPDLPEDLSAVDAVVGTNTGDTIFIALTGDDVSIAKARRLRSRGVDEVLPKTIEVEDLREVINELRKSRAKPVATSAQSSVGMGQLIAVAQSAGGSGATTAAVNLATALATKKGRFNKKTGAKVALLDLDIQFGSVGVLMDIEDNGGFLEMIESAAVPDLNYLKAIMQSHSGGVDVLVAPRQIAPLTALDPAQLATLIDVLKSNYDYVVVDMPRAFVEWLAPIISRLDELLIISDTSVPALRQAKRIIDFYREDNITVSTRVVISGESKPLIKSEQIREGEKLLETKFAHWIPENSKVARKAVDLGRPLIMAKPGSDIAKSYYGLAKLLEKEKSANVTLAS